MMTQIKGTLNNVELLGWLGNDPEMRFLANGTPVCRLSVATKRVSGQDASGQWEYETEWTNVETWERLAESCNTYLHKGSRVFVSGRLRTESWADKATGQPRSRTLVRANDVLFLDPRPGVPTEVATVTDDPAREDEDLF